MAFGYKVSDPSGKTTLLIAEDRERANERVCAMQGPWEDYCNRNWLNDSGDLFSPELKVKRFLDSLAYFLLIGNTKGIETDYKRIMHMKREIPSSNCPSFVDNLLYASGGSTDSRDKEERAAFDVLTESLDAKAETYEAQRTQRKRKESKFQKYLNLGIRGGEWLRVDTDGVFQYNGISYRIDEDMTQYQPVETELGLLYDMDRILATNPNSPEFYDMNYDRVKVSRFDSHD